LKVYTINAVREVSLLHYWRNVNLDLLELADVDARHYGAGTHVAFAG
jgi:hypothetical protein